ncbi:MAG TPA: hypothetical protein VF487_00050, partial [Chitinophagaceae bacterium]
AKDRGFCFLTIYGSTFIFKPGFIMKLFFTIMLLFGPGAVYSQRVIDLTKEEAGITSAYYSMIGAPIPNSKYVSVEGSLYFDPAWMKGRILLHDSIEYVNLFLRLDLFSNNVEFKDNNDQVFIASAPIKELTLTDTVNGKQFHFIHYSAFNNNATIEKGWYLLLVAGDVSLYKFMAKVVNESKPYSSAIVERRIETMDHYYLYSGSSLTRIKKIKDLPDLLPAKKAEITAYMKSNTLNSKNETDFSNIITYYNTLLKK